MTIARRAVSGGPRRVFRDRREAGQVLAGLLGGYRGRENIVVLGLARGGIPVAWEVAAALGAPLDAFIVRKLGAPGHDEFAMGALASGGRVVVNDDVVRALRVSPQQLRDVAEREGRELLRREAAYRGGRPPLELAGKTVILVDDGVATGASMFAAVQALREMDPAEIVIAVPAAPESTCREFTGVVDDVVCASMPTPFLAVGESFWDFRQVSDDEVRELLQTPTVGTGTARIRLAETPAEILGRCAVNAPAGVPPREALDELIGDARVVLIGESSHGTNEFYDARAEITKWLIEEKGFCAVAAEADWPDAYRVNRYVRGQGGDGSAEEALSGFERFPAWMWRNTVVRDFAGWLRASNAERRAHGNREAGFYGLDLYSLHRSMREVVHFLDNVDPAAAQRARERYSCFDHTSADDGQAYGFAAAFGAGLSCERQAVEQLVELHRNALEYARRDGMLAEDELFYAQQNAQTVRDAEMYYRAMFGGRVTSWNLRDRHMATTLEALLRHLDRHLEQRGGTEPARIVVWARNSHVGDGVAERKVVRPALNGSVEELFHEVDRPEFLVSPLISRAAAEPLDDVRLVRAIGVIYLPATERQSHYYHVRPGEQYDGIIHIDKTTALEPLEVTSVWVAGETPETYPTGL
ncbi:erythromycin esterase family protein [Mycobacterium sp. ZZG]